MSVVQWLVPGSGFVGVTGIVAAQDCYFVRNGFPVGVVQNYSRKLFSWLAAEAGAIGSAHGTTRSLA